MVGDCSILVLIHQPPRCVAFRESFSVALVRACIASARAFLGRQQGAVAEAASETPTHPTFGVADLARRWLLARCINWQLRLHVARNTAWRAFVLDFDRCVII